jgi:hypothetical protein
LEDEAASVPQLISAKSQIDATLGVPKKSKVSAGKKSVAAQSLLDSKSHASPHSPKRPGKVNNPPKLTPKVTDTPDVAASSPVELVEPKVEKISKKKTKRQIKLPVVRVSIAAKPDDIKRRRAIRRKRKKRLLVE